jgi:[acyl-carrier-protein] S-malonyltransferase
MQAAVPAGEGGMVVLRKTDVDEARAIAARVRSGACDVANLNSPGQIVLSGSARAMDEVMEIVGPRRGLRLAVSVPFHSSLLASAAAGFAAVLRRVTMRDPAFAIYCNVDARPVRDAAAARDALERQFARPVLWQQSVAHMLQDDGVRRFVEFGPKPTLVRMVTQIANELGIDDVVTASVTTADELEALRV